MAERKIGRPARWGARKTHSLGLPVDLADQLTASATAVGMNLTEYIVIKLAAVEGFELPSAHAVQDALPLGA